MSTYKAHDIFLKGFISCLSKSIYGFVFVENLGDNNYLIRSIVRDKYLGSIMAKAIHIGNTVKLVEEDDDSEDTYKVDHLIFKGCAKDQLYLDLVDPVFA